MNQDNKYTASEIMMHFYNLEDQKSLEGRSLREWAEYFDINVHGLYAKDYLEKEDVVMLRKKMAECSDKLDECLNIIARLKVTLGKMNSDEEQKINESFAKHKDSGVKTAAEAERRAKNENAAYRCSIKYVTGLLDAWEELKWKLIYKKEAINHLLISESTEMKYLLNSNYNS